MPPWPWYLCKCGAWSPSVPCYRCLPPIRTRLDTISTERKEARDGR